MNQRAIDTATRLLREGRAHYALYEQRHREWLALEQTLTDDERDAVRARLLGAGAEEWVQGR